MLKMMKRHNQVRPNASVRAHAASRGNTLMEYGISGALVMVVCIIGLQFLSGNLSTAMAKIRDDMQSRQQSAQSMHQMQMAMANAQAGGVLSAAEQALLEQSLSQKLQTTGANGSTQVLASQLAASAAQLLADGKIDQSQYDILLQLSNQGHKIAQIEGVVSDALKMANGNWETFKNMSFTIDGQTYQANQLASMLGYHGLFPDDFASADILSANRDVAGSELASFLDLYQQASASGALSDQTASDTVTSAATQIASMGEVVEDSVAKFGWGWVSAPSEVTTMQVSNASHMNSSKICKSGKFKDKGALCLL